MAAAKSSNIDEYIAGFPSDIQKILQDIRTAIQNTVPEATEAIKYNMPTFIFRSNLVHFAAFNNHIGFYPAPTANDVFERDLSAYKTGKGSIQFPYSQPIPLDLIAEIVAWRVKRVEAGMK
ncbi:iron chaperone [Dyadobacter sp. CY312]|uniref:iron chaperone n=1 Tax=Dyadobacter sp. CY312 TaxID=2907303 RepID=UPI001F20C67E|nr:DUF1801 domain-containing protein [Dyadobacter sp. CY312]MCE7043230.1 DUF1801 domain-containing protein [Dyadobacter sp. CY312]